MKVDYSEQGKKNRIKGRVFETKVRVNLEEMGWVVSKWMNTVDYERDGKIGKVVPAKRKYNPFLKTMIIGTGFPDFVAFRRKKEKKDSHEILGLEVKKNGYLDAAEKGMAYWLLENKIFPKIIIAKSGKKKGEIEYLDFRKKYGKK